MENTKHTQGDWEVSGYAGEHDEAGANIKCDDKFICSTSNVRNSNWGEYYANAKLIAAAPDLLNALEIYLNAGSKEQRRKASEVAKEAIKKATK